MGKIRNPALFSGVFKIASTRMRQLGVFDPILNGDTKLFIDPLLLQATKHKEFKSAALSSFTNYFGDLVRLLRASSAVNDVAWKAADKLLTFKEPKETCLGYGDRTISGSAIGSLYRMRIITTAKEIVDLGVVDPELFALLGLLEEGIGPDRISDLTTHSILPALGQFTQGVCAQLKIPTEKFKYGDAEYELPRNPFEAKPTGILLVPTDILRDLPVANDWSDVSDAAAKNEELRQRVNKQIGDIWAIQTAREKKRARDAALSSKESFSTLVEAVGRLSKTPYDVSQDAMGHFLLREALSSIAEKYPASITPPKEHSLKELHRVVRDIIDAFQELIEKKGQWFHLWHNGEPRHEKAAQMLFFAIADQYCKANNIDISPETDSGGGPVDFKFSTGYDYRVLVELKMSTGKVVHGYQTQLEVYKDAESTFAADYVILDVGKMGKKLQTIEKARNEALNKGLSASRIYVIDAMPQESASKR